MYRSGPPIALIRAVELAREIEITPEPTPEERAAILEALRGDEERAPQPASWADGDDEEL